MEPEEALTLAAARGWEQVIQGAEYRWCAPDGALSPRWNQWAGAVAWITIRMEAEPE